MLSSFTLISLVGVMLGVLVLVVVMAVYAGLERDVKSRLLGFTPHILLQSYLPGSDVDWDAAAEKARGLPHVKTANPFVADNVIIDVHGSQRPVMFRGIDTSDPAEVAGITKMLDLENHPQSTSDLGLDDRIVLSSVIADQFRPAIQVGDTIRLYSTRNFEQVMDVYKATANPPVHQHFAEWGTATKAIASGWTAAGETFTQSVTIFEEAYDLVYQISLENIREPERELLMSLLIAMEEGERDEAASVFRFSAEAKTSVEQNIAALNATEVEKMDSEVFKSLKSVVLPKEAEVVGIYQGSQMVVTPDIFTPLPLAQSLAGLDDSYQGIAISLDDAYLSEQVAAGARGSFGDEWALITWGDQYQAFFALINQQRVMMYFALSFIVLVSAFSMMAVMFTVTIQKRREIGVMKALGAAPGQIVRVFLYQGMILGSVGAVIGVVLGRIVIHFRGLFQEMFRSMGFDPFSASFTGFGVLPAHNDPTEQVVIAFIAFVLCSLAALVPAFFAARSDAAKSLRNL